MKRILSLLVLTLAMLSLRAQTVYLPDTLSPTAYIAVMTCGPGNELGENFGHSALRVCDTAQQFDLVYNYGTFDFDDPNFVLNFCKGRLNYWLSVSPFWAFAMSYQSEGRSVTEQRLALTADEKNRIFHALDSNARPENKYYAYDFLLDNCATRPRDIINNNLIGRRLFVEQTTDSSLTYRQLLYPYTEGMPWFRFGIDMILGSRCDRKTSNMEQMFAPDQLKNQIDTTRLSDTHQPLAITHSTIIPETRPLPSCHVTPNLVFWALLAVVLMLTAIGRRRQWQLVWFDAPLFATVGLASLIVLYMWFGSEHYCTKPNLNILWASPLFLYFAIGQRKSWQPLMLLQIAMLAVLAVGFWWLPQRFNAAVFPLALCLMVRIVDKYLHCRKQRHNNCKL